MVPMRRYPQALMTSAQDSCGVTITMSTSSRSLIMWKTTTRVGISKVKGRDRRMHMHSLRIYN